jgi:hypothetical protein
MLPLMEPGGPSCWALARGKCQGVHSLYGLHTSKINKLHYMWSIQCLHTKTFQVHFRYSFGLVIIQISLSFGFYRLAELLSVQHTKLGSHLRSSGDTAPDTYLAASGPSFKLTQNCASDSTDGIHFQELVRLVKAQFTRPKLSRSPT